MTDSTHAQPIDLSVPEDPPTPGQTGGPRTLRRRLVFVAIAILVPLFLVRVVLTFLGGQVQSILAGTVEFGTGGSGCLVEGRAATLSHTGTMHVVANLRRDVKANEVIRVTVTDAAGSSDETQKTVAGTANCMSMNIPLERVDPGRLVFEFWVGSESLAKGEVVIGP